MSLISFVGNVASSIYNTIKGWVNDFLNSAVGVLLTKATDIIRGLLDDGAKGIAWVIHQATVLIEEAKFHLGKDIQKLYNTTLGFWGILAATIIGVIVLPGAVAWAIKVATSTKLYATILKLIGDVKSWQGWQAINIAIEANRVAIVLFQNWRDIWQGIYADIETIAGDMGLGFGALSAVTTSTKAILTTIYNAVGGTELSAETSALAQMQGWLASLSNDFNTYAQNPQAIWNDLWANVIVPAQGYIRNYTNNTIKQIASLNTAITKLEGLPKEFVNFQTDTQKLLGIQLSAQESKIEQKVLTQIQKTIDQYNTNIGDKITAIEKAVGPLQAAITAHDEAIAKNSASIAAINSASAGVPTVMTTAYIANVLGGQAGIDIAYMASDQFGIDVTNFIEYLKKGTDLNMGLITEEQFTEYLNSLSQYKFPVVNPLAV